MAERGHRRVFRGRLVGDGMWAAHLSYGIWTACGLAIALWFCRGALTPGTPQSTRALLIGIGLLLGCVVSLPFIVMWRDALRPVILRPDALQVGRVVVPYEHIVSLGLSRQAEHRLVPADLRQRGARAPRSSAADGDVVLAVEECSAPGPVRRQVPLPGWVAGNRDLQDELRNRAPRMVLRPEGLYVRAVRSFSGAVFFLWCTVATAILSAYFLPPLRTRFPWLTTRNVVMSLSAGTLLFLAYTLVAPGVAERRERRRIEEGKRERG